MHANGADDQELLPLFVMAGLCPTAVRFNLRHRQDGHRLHSQEAHLWA